MYRKLFAIFIYLIAKVASQNSTNNTTTIKTFLLNLEIEIKVEEPTIASPLNNSQEFVPQIAAVEVEYEVEDVDESESSTVVPVDKTSTTMVEDVGGLDTTQILISSTIFSSSSLSTTMRSTATSSSSSVSQNLNVSSTLPFYPSTKFDKHEGFYRISLVQLLFFVIFLVVLGEF